MTAQLTKKALQFYEDDPVAFCNDMIGVKCDDWQKEAFEELYKYRFLAIKAGSGVGKSEWLSLVTMHFLSTKPYSIVPSTAPSQHQLEDVLWQKHFSNIQRSDYLNSMMSWTQRRVAVKGKEGAWYAVARTARVSGGGKVAEGLQGFHAADGSGGLCYILDEASGVPDEIFPAVEGALSSDKTYAIMAANPTRLTGYFHAVFTHPKLKGQYKLRTVSCLDSQFVEERYITMMKAMYGEDHPIYKIKVLGDFPSSDIELLFAYADIEQMKFNDIIDQRGDRTSVEIGVDIGRTTAKSTMCIRKGLRILEYQSKHLSGTTVDAVEITQWILDAVHAYEPSSVKIDANGIGGPIFDSLSRVYPKIFRPVLGQASPGESKRSRYLNLRAQGYWEFKILMPNICCDNWPDTLFDEMSDMRYKLSNGKIQIESKEDMQRRNKPSPDFTDATVYAFLDSTDCVDKANPIIIPTMLNAFNDGLTKRNPLLHLGDLRVEENTIRSNKWSALHG
jgi:phage terminase large subunit